MMPLAGMIGVGWNLLKAAFEILKIGITVPVGIILAVGIWVYVDKKSSIRNAVDRAVTELVAGAELEAERKRSAGLMLIVEEQRRRAELARMAAEEFEKAKAAADAKIGELENEITDIENRPVDDRCLVDSDLLNRLHNK